MAAWTSRQHGGSQLVKRYLDFSRSGRKAFIVSYGITRHDVVIMLHLKSIKSIQDILIFSVKKIKN